MSEVTLKTVAWAGAVEFKFGHKGKQYTFSLTPESARKFGVQFITAAYNADNLLRDGEA